VEQTYAFLIDVRKHLLKFITDGAVIRDVYAEALSYIRDKKPELEKKFPKNIGFGVCLVIWYPLTSPY
jgi:nucleosome binding factor SPN SPT16 subunit